MAEKPDAPMSLLDLGPSESSDSESESSESDDEEDIFIVTGFKRRQPDEAHDSRDPLSMDREYLDNWKQTEIEHYNHLLGLRDQTQLGLQAVGSHITDLISFKDILFSTLSISTASQSDLTEASQPAVCRISVTLLRGLIMLITNLYLDFSTLVTHLDTLFQVLFIHTDDENYDFVGFRFLMRQYIKLEMIVRKYEDDLAISLTQIGKLSPELDKLTQETKMLETRNEVLLKRNAELERQVATLHKQLAESFVHRGRSAIKEMRSNESESKREIERINDMFHTEISSMGLRLEQFRKIVGDVLNHPDNRLSEDSATKLYAMRIHVGHLAKKFKKVDQSIQVLEGKLGDLMKKKITGAQMELKMVRERKSYNLRMKYARRNLVGLGPVVSELKDCADWLGSEIISRKRRQQVVHALQRSMGEVERLFEVVNDILSPINPQESIHQQMHGIPKILDAATPRFSTKGGRGGPAVVSSPARLSATPIAFPRRRRDSRPENEMEATEATTGPSARSPAEPLVLPASSSSDDAQARARRRSRRRRRRQQQQQQRERQRRQRRRTDDDDDAKDEPTPEMKAFERSVKRAARNISLKELNRDYVTRKYHVSEMTKLYRRLKSTSALYEDRIQELERALLRSRREGSTTKKQLSRMRIREELGGGNPSSSSAADPSSPSSPSVLTLNFTKAPEMHDVPMKTFTVPIDHSGGGALFGQTTATTDEGGRSDGLDEEGGLDDSSSFRPPPMIMSAMRPPRPHANRRGRQRGRRGGSRGGRGRGRRGRTESRGGVRVRVRGRGRGRGGGGGGGAEVPPRRGVAPEGSGGGLETVQERISQARTQTELNKLRLGHGTVEEIMAEMKGPFFDDEDYLRQQKTLHMKIKHHYLKTHGLDPVDDDTHAEEAVRKATETAFARMEMVRQNSADKLPTLEPFVSPRVAVTTTTVPTTSTMTEPEEVLTEAVEAVLEEEDRQGTERMKRVLVSHIDSLQDLISGVAEGAATDPPIVKIQGQMKSVQEQIHAMQRNQVRRRARRRRFLMARKKKRARLVNVADTAFHRRLPERMSPRPEVDGETLKLPALFPPFKGPPEGFQKMLEGVDVERIAEQTELNQELQEEGYATVRIGSPRV